MEWKTDFTGWPWRQGQTGNQPKENDMNRPEYEDVEATAIAALIGLTAVGGLAPDHIATRAFDIAEAFQQEKLRRIGEKPGFED